LKPGRVIEGELPDTGNPVGPLVPLGGGALLGLGILLVRRRPAR
jgi:LPXTG-motif cell wall-anchored protein